MDENEHPGQNNGPLPDSPVSDAESGQKLLRLLGRRLGLPETLLHRWVRTGQIRVNGKRYKPFERLESGDLIRIPPFAPALACEASRSGGMTEACVYAGQEHPIPDPLALLERWNGILALNKPAGLPVQSGTGHEDSVCRRLAGKGSFFYPTPAHRLDRHTSGVLLVGETFSALRYLQDAFREGRIHKEYLAWVDGIWPWKADLPLKHFLRREKREGRTKTRVYREPVPYAREAISIARFVGSMPGRSLLQIRILTGRTHQVRAQLAFCGFPVLGDGKYGNPGPCLYLHALRVILPDGHEFACLPGWTNDFAVAAMPLPIAEIPASEQCRVRKN